MEFHDSQENRRFREETRHWLRTNRPTEPRPHDIAGQMAYDRQWQQAQFEGGWAGLHWPKEYGGRGLSAFQQVIWCEEYIAAHCPPIHDSCWLGLNHAGPTLIVRGTEAQKSFHLPRILSGRSAWCQGFSEPNAGSDMASLKTRAVVDGEHLVVNGQKIWTTYAHLADYQELLVRTGSADARHRGLTWVICDMRFPGVEVRPIAALDGRYHNCEVFYDNVRIPLSNVVGEVGNGWSVAMTTFRFERGAAAFGGACEGVGAIEELIDYARHNPGPEGGRPAIEDEALAERLGVARAEAEALRSLMYLMASAAERDVDLGAEGGLIHLSYSELEQSIYRLALEILGPRGLSRLSSSSWVYRYFTSFGATIAGGTSEIHRNIIGERLLGLPR
jgi:alkylation response protein AidB-like acyl-CoA dehydrogenase